MARIDPEVLGIDKQLWKEFLQTFNTTSGQNVLKYLQNSFYFTKSTYEGNKDETLVNEGSRRVLLTIETILKMRFDEQVSEPEGGEDG